MDAICHVARLTPGVAHWVATREKAMVLAWHADRGHTLPDNVTIRISGTMVNGEPNKGLPAGIVTSTVHRGKDRKPQPYDCPALTQGDRCLDCRNCWDRSVQNVSYQFHNYGNTAEADMPREVWLAMNQSRKEKKYGTDKWTLVPETMGEEIPFADMQGEFNVLTNPIFDYAFERVLEQHEPKHSLAFLSLCAASNDKSRKWKTYAKEFTNVELIVCSNAGVVPFDMWRRYYPYRSYDAPRAGGHWDELYVEKMYERLLMFFGKFKYERVIANFIPTNERCLTACHKALGELRERGRIKSYAVLPTWDTYEAMRERLNREGRPNGTYHPDVEVEIMDVLQKRIADWTEK